MQVDQNRRIILRRLMILASFLLFLFSAANAQPAGPVQNGLNTGFDPLTAIVVVIVVVAFFFIGMVFIFLRQCSEPAGGGNYPSYAGAARYIRSRLPHGLDKSVIESFPVLARSAIGGELECAVCLCEFEDDQSFRLLPKCRHVFHPVCIDTWLASHVTCPVCRANLEHGSSDSGDPTPEFNIPVGDFERLRPVRITGGKFPRSHSTGHSLAAVGVDRYTLRISEEQMTEVIDRARLERAASFNAGGGYFPREWNSRKGYKGNFNEEDGPGRGGRWVVFWMTPPFVSRGPGAVMLSKPVDGNGDGGGSGNVRDTKITARPLV